MRGVKAYELVALIDFIYRGEANIFQENLEAFLTIAEEMQLRGLTGGGEETQDIGTENLAIKIPSSHIKPLVKNERQSSNKFMKTNEVVSNGSTEDTFLKGIVAISNDVSFGGSDKLDQQIKSLMVTGVTNLGKGQGFTKICTLCQKEGHARTIMDHIEAKHIEGVCHTCNLCEKTFRLRKSFRKSFRNLLLK